MVSVEKQINARLKEKYVLILILMEDGFCYLKNKEYELSKIVLILILMEDGFCSTFTLADSRVFVSVLILILMEDGFC